MAKRTKQLTEGRAALIAFMAENGLTQKQVADRLGMSRQAVIFWLREDAPFAPGPETREVLKEWMGIQPTAWNRPAKTEHRHSSRPAA
jgi:transcriptional regulator with XRE-family HTH domain